MAIAISILVVGIIFAIIYLYSITQDKWNWLNIISISSIPLIVIFTFFFYLILKMFEVQDFYLGTLLISSAFIILFILKNLTKKILTEKKNTARKFLAKYKQVGIGLVIVIIGGFLFRFLENYGKEYSKEISLKQEDASRKCNAQEILRIEPLLDKAFNSINMNSSFADAKNILEKISKESSKNIIQPVVSGIPNDDIMLRYISLDIVPDCNSKFYYQIQITADQSNQLLIYQTSAINPPKGYRWKGRLSFIPDHPPLLPIGLKEEKLIDPYDGKVHYLPPENFFAIWGLTADFKEQRRVKGFNK